MWTYYLFASSGMYIDEKSSYRDHFESLKGYVLHGGIQEVVGMEGESHFDFVGWLEQNGIAYYFEWLSIYRDHSEDSLYVLHVYSENDAFIIRMHTDYKPLIPQWRDVWALGGFEAVCNGGLK